MAFSPIAWASKVGSRQAVEAGRQHEEVPSQYGEGAVCTFKQSSAFFVKLRVVN
jgi:hypothetical protein